MDQELIQVKAALPVTFNSMPVLLVINLSITNVLCASSAVPELFMFRSEAFVIIQSPQM